MRFFKNKGVSLQSIAAGKTTAGPLGVLFARLLLDLKDLITAL